MKLAIGVLVLALGGCHGRVPRSQYERDCCDCWATFRAPDGHMVPVYFNAQWTAHGDRACDSDDAWRRLHNIGQDRPDLGLMWMGLYEVRQ